MAHHARGQHWRDLGKSKSLDLPDKSTGAILGALKTPQQRYPITSHEGVASVGADGIKPTKHNGDNGPNAAANAEFNAGTVGPRETTDAARLIGAGIIKGN